MNNFKSYIIERLKLSQHIKDKTTNWENLLIKYDFEPTAINDKYHIFIRHINKEVFNNVLVFIKKDKEKTHKEHKRIRDYMGDDYCDKYTYTVHSGETTIFITVKTVKNEQIANILFSSDEREIKILLQRESPYDENMIKDMLAKLIDYFISYEER